MNGHRRFLFLFVLLLTVTGCAIHPYYASNCPDLRYVTLAQILESLPGEPIVVGFDIDDTVLFSSPGFYYGLNNRDGPGETNRYGAQPLASPRFWNDMNGYFDKFSLPKKSGTDLVKMHHARGDNIVFITARNDSDESIVARLLAQLFAIPEPKVIFTSDAPKTEFIRAEAVSLYYGDADSDITEAREAKARPIRVMRSVVSINRASSYNLGALGEEILVQSDR